MATPFKIPKRSQPTDVTDSLQMQSPLSRVHDSNGPAKTNWGQSEGDRSDRTQSWNGLSSRAQREGTPLFRDVVKARLGLGCPIRGSSSVSTGYRTPGQTLELHSANHWTDNPERRKWNFQSRSATPTHQVAQRPPMSPSCFSLGRRPMRASDRLFPEENKQCFSGPEKTTSRVELSDLSLSVKSSSVASEDSLPNQSPEDEAGNTSPNSLGETEWSTAESRMNGSDLESTEEEKSRPTETLQNGSEENTSSGKGTSGSNSDHTSEEESVTSSPTRTSGSRAVSSAGSSKTSLSPILATTLVPRMRHAIRLSLNRTSWLTAHHNRQNEGKEREREEERRRERGAASRSRSLHLRLGRRPKQTSSELIVLSSEEEEGHEDEGERGKRTSESSSREKTPQLQHTPGEQTQAGSGEKGCGFRARGGHRTDSVPQPLPSVMELSFVRLHAGMITAEANGNITITDDGITLPLKDPESTGNEGVSVSIVASQVQGYGMWDGALARDGTLLQDWEGPAPSLLFLWITEAQANLLQAELSAIYPVEPGQSCPFLLLVLSDQLGDLQAALLASMLDVEAYQFGSSPDMSSPLGWTDGLALLHSCPPPLDTYLLFLLGQTGERTSRTKASPRKSSRLQGLPSRLIQYPLAPCKGRITVTTEDLACLEMGEFLNDVIIDFYLKYLLLERAQTEVAERCHVFSSFFYKQLTKRDAAGEEEDPTIPARDRRHQRVKTWTRHVDIFSKDYLFVPVNQSAHWYLVVICFPGLEKAQVEEWHGPAMAEGSGVKRKLEAQPDRPSLEAKGPNGTLRCSSGSQTSAGGANRAQGKPTDFPSRSHKPPECTQDGWKRETVCKRPCILVMDSLKLSYRNHVCKLLWDYLHVEWEVRRGTPRSFTNDNMRSSHCRVPLQDNSSDCGLYLLQYVESFLLNPVVNFDLPLQLGHWFPRQQVWRKREEIRRLVMLMHKSQQNTEDANR